MTEQTERLETGAERSSDQGTNRLSRTRLEAGGACESDEACRPSEQPCCETEVAMPMPQNKRQISVEPMDLGYIVRVGCQTFAVETKESLIEKFTKYINDPIGVEKEWMKNRKF